MLFSQGTALFKPLTLCFFLWLLQLSQNSSANETTCNRNDEIKVLGLIELVAIHSSSSGKSNTKALLDTGATNSAIHARNIAVRDNHSGRPVVSFDIKDEHTGKWKNFSRPLIRYAWIKTHKGKPVKKVVVSLPVKVGNISGTSEFYLMDRQAFKYPMLLGRSFLKDRAVVDVSRQNIANQPLCMEIVEK